MKRRQGGFSYLIALFLVAAVALVSVRALENVAASERRRKEAELLLVGQAYRNAIKAYYLETEGYVKVYPPTLEELLKDVRMSVLTRPLRKRYRDPMTASGDWGIVEAEGGGVMGVYSRSTLKPYKTGGFPPELAAFANAKQYQEWRFVYEPE